MSKMVPLCAHSYTKQDTETGGFADRPGDLPDPFHTLFGVAGLGLLGDERGKKVGYLKYKQPDISQTL